MSTDLHRLGEERSIALHRAVAERLRNDPSLIARARARVRRWLETGEVHRAYAEAWNSLLSKPLEELVQTLVDPSEESKALRQVSPFAGVLDPRERWRIRRESARKVG